MNVAISWQRLRRNYMTDQKEIKDTGHKSAPSNSGKENASFEHNEPKRDKEGKENLSKDKSASTSASYGAAAEMLGLGKEELLPEQETLQEVHKQLNELEKSNDDHRQKWLRALAELENVRRIAKRDITNAHKFALEKFAADLLPIMDSLDQGLEHAVSQDTALQALREGMEMTRKMFIDVFGKYGIQTLYPEGELFNAEFHEAICMEVREEVKPNTIIKVVQKGYLLNERVIRPARVVVAKAS